MKNTVNNKFDYLANQKNTKICYGIQYNKIRNTEVGGKHNQTGRRTFLVNVREVCSDHG